MRIMIDTNVLISAILFPGSSPTITLQKVIEKHNLVLCSHIIDEVHIVFERKFPEKIKNLERFLSKLSYELVYTPLDIEMNKYPQIRDNGDLPILVSAILADVDIIITGDKDFQSIEIEKPIVLTPREFLNIY
ncbi:putative toxin-antitoxin system toxin component, PIN family [Thermanaerosceptrum fracticalcis]|uniref:Putative toxin-antitoxin system toxin component, PIN family n=1 Tax=Thermanaerosceptrum fracticalcis TaxID=1712410 RepID=A0A7G6E6F8_THEFR|nr:putative toxin-antitoxin system toxin component, PIN family [Thermanaerosceptrum fracticalcis]QNB47662.1 putative toxin-antitoxin system toxin component, PIN family [Thermanaerosceptrum fracticalcis]